MIRSPNKRKNLYHKRQKLGLITRKENLIIIIRNSKQKISVLIIYIFGSKIWGPGSLEMVGSSAAQCKQN